MSSRSSSNRYNQEGKHYQWVSEVPYKVQIREELPVEGLEVQALQVPC